MLIGLLSDTHGRVDAAAAAIKLLRERGATYFIHCGDIGSLSVLDYFAGLPAACVWGNCDYDRSTLCRYADRLGIQCFGSFGELSLDGKSIALIHGDDHRLRQRLLDEQKHDYLFQGHTHSPDDLRIGRTHLVNPGALHRARTKTVALVDTAADTVELLAVSDETSILR